MDCLRQPSSAGVHCQYNSQKPVNLSQTSTPETDLGSQCRQDIYLSTRDPRSSDYRQPRKPSFTLHMKYTRSRALASDLQLKPGCPAEPAGHAMQTRQADSDWTIKTYMSRNGKIDSHSTRSPHLCRLTPSCGQPLHRACQHIPPQPPVVPPVWSIEPSADPWNTSWDTEAPDDLKSFLLDVLLMPNQSSKHISGAEQHKQNLEMALDSSTKAASPASLSQNKGATTVLAEVPALQGGAEQPSASLQTLSDHSMDSDAATATADFIHASGPQQRRAGKPSLQTPSSRKRSRELSEQTDAQTAPDILVTQSAVGRPAKKFKGATGSKSAKPKLSSAEVAQAAKDSVVFAKFARFAHWPAQVIRQYTCL